MVCEKLKGVEIVAEQGSLRCFVDDSGTLIFQIKSNNHIEEVEFEKTKANYFVDLVKHLIMWIGKDNARKILKSSKE